MSAAATIKAAHNAQLLNQRAEPLLSCDNNLAPLVLFLFLAGWFLWSSLKTGVQTTRVVVRLARDGCREGSIPVRSRKMATSLKGSLGRGAPLLPATVQMGFRWAKSCVTLAGPAMPLNRAKLSNGVRAMRALPGNLSKRVAARRQLQVRADRPANPCLAAATKADEAYLEHRWGPVRLAIAKNCIPYRAISRVWGMATRLPIPVYWLKWAVYQGWATAFGCNLSEMRFPIEQYSNLSSFFLRPLRDGVRAIDANAALVSPVDGKVLHVSSAPLGDFDDVVLEQVKGVSYRLRDFLGEVPASFAAGPADPSRKLNSIVLYLSPGDYHHFHSAGEVQFTELKHFPGDLLPVKPSFAQQVDGLYCINERVVLNGSWAQGFFSYVAVGALNVGSIEIACAPELRTNVPGCRSGCFAREFEAPVSAVRAERLGAFHLGSTVVLIFESDADFAFQVQPGEVVKVGQPLDRRPAEAAQAEPPMQCPPWPASVAAAN